MPTINIHDEKWPGHAALCPPLQILRWCAHHRSLLNSATSISRSLASSGASVSLVIASAFGAAFSASLLTGARQADQQTAAVLGIGAGLGQAARSQPVDHALDGGDIHRGQPTELILRARPGLGQFRQGRPLRRRQIDADLAREDGGMALPDLAQDEADLLLEDIGRPRRFWTSFGRTLLVILLPLPSAPFTTPDARRECPDVHRVRPWCRKSRCARAR